MKREYSEEGRPLTCGRQKAEWEHELLDICRRDGVKWYSEMEEHGNRYYCIQLKTGVQRFHTNATQGFIDQLREIIRRQKEADDELA